MRHLYFNLKDLFSNRKGFVILTSLLRFKNNSREFREYAAFILTYHLTLCSGNAALNFIALNGVAQWLIAERRHSSTICFFFWIKGYCMRTAAVGKAARLSIYWQDTAYRLVISERQVKFAQLYKYHHQSGKGASRRLVWKQHYLFPVTLTFIKLVKQVIGHVIDKGCYACDKSKLQSLKKKIIGTLGPFWSLFSSQQAVILYHVFFLLLLLLFFFFFQTKVCMWLEPFYNQYNSLTPYKTIWDVQQGSWQHDSCQHYTRGRRGQLLALNHPNTL